MVDKEFTQICKEILELDTQIRGLSSQVSADKSEVSENAAQTLSAKERVEELNSAISLIKSDIDGKKEDFDSKYDQIASLLARLSELREQIERILQSTPITDQSVSGETAYSSQKVEQIKTAIDGNIQTLTQTLNGFRGTTAQNISSINQQINNRYTKNESNGMFLGKTAKAADSDKLDGLDSSAFAKLSGGLNSFTNENRFDKNTHFGRAFINAPTDKLNLQMIHSSNGKSIVFTVKTDGGQLENFWLNPTGLSLANKNLDVGTGVIYNSKPSTPLSFTNGSLIAFKNSDNAIQYTTVEKLIEVLKNSLADVNTLFGVGQTWQDVKNQRRSNIVYTNTTRRPIMVAVTYTVASGNHGLQIEVNEKVVTNGANASAVIVPAGNTYKVTMVGNARIATWLELR